MANTRCSKSGDASFARGRTVSSSKSTALSVGLLVCAVSSVLAGVGRSESCISDNNDLTLPAGFCSTVFADGVGRARHITVSSTGDVFVQLWSYDDGPPAGSVVALRDLDGNGKAETQLRFGTRGGDDIEWRQGYLYASTSDSIIRYKMPAGELEPHDPPEEVIGSIPTFPVPEHTSHTFAFAQSKLFVHVGAPSNA